jgi:hypothetical protein
MLKDNKKLTSKVESLTRKVVALQNKLTAAKDTNSSPLMAAAEPMPAPPPSRPRSITLTATSPGRPHIPLTRERIASGPSVLPRPKSPEKRTPLSVFRSRSRSPEKVSAEAPSESPSTAGNGKKRRAPEDFDSASKLQEGRYPDGGVAQLGQSEPSSPRRRVLTGLQSGFTPKRERPLSFTSDKQRPEPLGKSPFMADLTNGLYPTAAVPPASSDKPMKRSWLGKIRGERIA